MNKPDVQKTFIDTQLEISASDRESLNQTVQNYTTSFLNSLPEKKAYIAEGYDKTEEDVKFRIDGLRNSIDDLLDFIDKRVDNIGLNPASGGHLGYIPGGGIYSAALGDYMAAVTNRYAGIFYASPGAVRMENAVIDWVGRLVGYKDGFGGNITSGGSIANLIALSTAKIAHKIKSRDIDNAVIYTTHQSHHSIQKALRLTGLEECVLRFIEMDAQFRINTVILKKQIQIDKQSRLKPFLVIANAGSTDVGVVDDLKAIAKITKDENLWLHVDAAYGGFFLLTHKGKVKLKGIDLADSVTLDPHKGLFLPYGAGMILVKDIHKMAEANQYEASYMQDATSRQEEVSPAELSPELSRNFRGMRIWLPLKLHGIQPFTECLEEKLSLTQYFCQQVQEMGFELGNEPDLTVAIFRYLPKNRNSDSFNKKLLEKIHQDGTVFISSTHINDKFWLRIAILSFRTHQNEIDYLLKLLRESIQNQ